MVRRALELVATSSHRSSAVTSAEEAGACSTGSGRLEAPVTDARKNGKIQPDSPGVRRKRVGESPPKKRRSRMRLTLRQVLGTCGEHFALSAP